MEDAELRDRPRLIEAALDADADRATAVAVEELMPPDLGSVVQPRSGAVGVVPVREEDGGNLDLRAASPFERLSHLGRCAGGVARVDDKPFGPFFNSLLMCRNVVPLLEGRC